MQKMWGTRAYAKELHNAVPSTFVTDEGWGADEAAEAVAAAARAAEAAAKVAKVEA